MVPARRLGPLFRDMYAAMADRLGPSGWWPADTPFEVLVGTILAQNTNWANASRAVEALKERGLMNGPALLALAREDQGELAGLIRSSGHFRLKAVRLANLLQFVDQACGFDLEALAAMDMDLLRERLLGVRGVGPETADSILLYALGLPSFVVDAYTMRIAGRHGLIHEDAGYEELRALFMDALDDDAAMYNEMHALLVRTAAQWCKKSKPRCGECPLGPFLG